MRPFEGILEKPGVLFTLAASTAAIAVMLACTAYLHYSLRQVGTSIFAAFGAILTGYFAWHYYTDARSLSRRFKGSKERCGSAVASPGRVRTLTFFADTLRTAKQRWSWPMKAFWVLLGSIPLAGAITFSAKILGSWEHNGRFDALAGISFLLCLGFTWALVAILRHPEYFLTADGKLRPKRR